MLGQVSDVDIRLLRVFVTIVDCGGFAAAQAHLNVTESTISTHMNHLEQRLGLRLCERGRGGFRLTADGEAVYGAARELFDSLEGFRSRVASRRRQMSGALNIGMPDNTITHRGFPLGEAIHRFCGRDNDVHLTLHVLTPRELERGVLEGRLDLAVGPEHQRVAGLRYVRLFRERNYFYCGRRHPLYARANRRLELAEIAAAGRIGRGYLSRFDHRFFGPAPYSATVFSMEAAAVLILSGRFGGFLPAHYAQRWVDSGEMRALRPDLLTYTPDISAFARRDLQPTLPAKTFVADLLDAAKAMGDAVEA
jgi:DNA-binding transcriptional LysR family regulator